MGWPAGFRDLPLPPNVPTGVGDKLGAVVNVSNLEGIFFEVQGDFDAISMQIRGGIILGDGSDWDDVGYAYSTSAQPITSRGLITTFGITVAYVCLYVASFTPPDSDPSLGTLRVRLMGRHRRV